MSLMTHPKMKQAKEQTTGHLRDLLWRFSVEQYHSMITAGILDEDDQVELLEGWLVRKMTINPKHRATVLLIMRQMMRMIPPGWYVDAQAPVTLDASEPEPDVVVARGDTVDYLERHPGASDVTLVVEVSDATLQRDRTRKKRIYARAGIATYWIVNLINNTVEVYCEPQTSGKPDYRSRQIYSRSETLPLVIDGLEIGQIHVAEILPKV